MKTFLVILVISAASVTVTIEAGPFTAMSMLLIVGVLHIVASDLYLFLRTKERMETLADDIFFKRDK